MLYGILLLLNIICPTRQNTEPQNSNVVLTVFRGTRTDTDRVSICPVKPGMELDPRYTESKTMNCSKAKDGGCGQNGVSCVCLKNTATYVVSQRQCVNNFWLREGKHR